MTVQYNGPEFFERVLVRKIGDRAIQGAIPLEVDGVFVNAALGEDGVLHINLDELGQFVEEQKAAMEAAAAEQNGEVVTGLQSVSGAGEVKPTPNRRTRRSK